MHFEKPLDTPVLSAATGPWYKELNRYHWFVLIVAALGWLFDCLDQQLFILARQPAMRELLVVVSSRDDAVTLVEREKKLNTSSAAAELDSAASTKLKKPAQDLTTAQWNQVLQGVVPGYMQGMIDAYSGYATSIFLLGWASGGLFFGVLGDRIGRAKTMLMTILLYSLFTGLSSLSVGFWDFAMYRFLTGLGVGGEFAVGVALVAEVMPDRARPYALSVLQALSAIGNVSAAVVAMTMGSLEQAGVLESTWRPMFIVGAVPALLALVIRRKLKEPERWQQVAQEVASHPEEEAATRKEPEAWQAGSEEITRSPQPAAGTASGVEVRPASRKVTVARKLGSYRALFSDPRWRRHALIGLAMAFSGVVGLWAVGFFTMDLVGGVLRTRFESEGLPAGEVNGKVAFWKGITSMMINLGAFIGMYTFGVVTQRIGRKATFALAFVSAGLSTAAVFWFLQDFSQIFWMVPIMGICQLSLFAGYAIYFPELFPTYLRSTGTSFCYNVGRFVAAVGPALLALLTSVVFKDSKEPLRYAGLTMCSVFFIGLLVLPLAPETKGKPLPE